jgi:hypothetical protein
MDETNQFVPSNAAGAQDDPQNSVPASPQIAPAAPVSPALQAAPPVSTTSPNSHMHNFIGRVLTALAGPAPSNYQTDATTGRLVASSPQESPSQKIRRITNNALIGLSAGAEIPQQKSGLASALAGLGAGAGAVRQQDQEQDLLRRKQAREDFEEQQQAMLHKVNVARLNALTLSTYFANLKMGNDLNPQYEDNRKTLDELKAANVPTQIINTDEAKQKVSADKNFALTHTFLELGHVPMLDSDGHPILDANGQPREIGQVGVIDTAHEGKLAVPQATIDALKKYGKYSQSLSGGFDSLKAGDEVDMKQYIHLLFAIQEGEKSVLKGQAEAEDGFGGKDGKLPGKVNRVTGEFVPNPSGAKTTKQVEAEANANAPSKTGAVTEADRYKEGQANYRAELAKRTAQADSMGKQGATELQKQADDYSKFLFTANSAKSSIANARNGDELANSLGPLQTALLVTSANGVHRINMTEVEAAGPKVGSLGRRIDAALEKAGRGKLPADTLKEMAQLVDLYSKAKYDAYVKNTAYTAKLRGLDPTVTPVMDSDGNTVNLSDAVKNISAPVKLPAAPPGKVAVQIPGLQPGFIPKESLAQFKKDHPNAVVGAE